MSEITLKEKDAIRDSLRAYVEKYPSQNKAVGSLKGTSAGTVSTILNGKYENVSEEMFRNIASQMGVTDNNPVVETNPYKYLIYAMRDAQEFRNTTWIVAESGCGKTFAAQTYKQENREVFFIPCTQHMTRPDFIRDVARTVGIKPDGYTLTELWDMIINQVIQMESPLMIFDEADSLKDHVFIYFKSLYNLLQDKCGIVFLSTDQIKRRMTTGLRYNRMGYKEIYSRIGRKFYEVNNNTASDVYAICIANGLKDKAKINEVIKDAETCDFDLRRVKKSIHRVKRLEGK